MAQQDIRLKIITFFVVGIIVGVGFSQLYLTVTQPSQLPNPSPNAPDHAACDEQHDAFGGGILRCCDGGADIQR